MKKVFTMVGIVIGVMILFWLFIGFLSHWGKPYIEISMENDVQILKNPWPNIADESFIYTLQIASRAKWRLPSRESIFIIFYTNDSRKYYSRPIGEPVDYISITKSEKDVIFSLDDKNTNKSFFPEADKKFNLVKKELKVDELLKNFIKN